PNKSSVDQVVTPGSPGFFYRPRRWRERAARTRAGGLAKTRGKVRRSIACEFTRPSRELPKFCNSKAWLILGSRNAGGAEGTRSKLAELLRVQMQACDRGSVVHARACGIAPRVSRGRSGAEDPDPPRRHHLQREYFLRSLFRHLSGRGQSAR